MTAGAYWATALRMIFRNMLFMAPLEVLAVGCSLAAGVSPTVPNIAAIAVGAAASNLTRRPAREAIYRRVARRPRMTPVDYARLRELELELGYEPSEPAAPVKAPAPQSRTPMRPLPDYQVIPVPPACDCRRCGDDISSVQVRVPESPDPLRSYCLECGRQVKQRESRALAAAVAAERRSSADTVKAADDLKAAVHFAELARVGREFCLSYCPICARRLLDLEGER